MLKSSFGKQFTRKEKKKKNYKQLIPNVIKSSAVAAVWVCGRVVSSFIIKFSLSRAWPYNQTAKRKVFFSIMKR